MRLTIHHLTRYHYDEEVKFSTQYLRLTPRNTARQHIQEWTLELPVENTFATTDAYGNVMHVLTLDRPHKEIVIKAQGVVELADYADDSDDNVLSPLVFLRSSPLTEPSHEIREFALRYYRAQAPEESLNTLMDALRLKIPCAPDGPDNASAADVFARSQGVCQDQTHVFLACCRSLHIPARYVNGYVYQEESEQQSMHAWAEAWLNNHWQRFDITHNTSQLRQHLRLAVGLDYMDACPVRASRTGGGGEEMFSSAEIRQCGQQQQPAQQQQ